MIDTQETNVFDRVKYLEKLLNINQGITEELEKENKELKKIVEGYREAKNVIQSLNPTVWGDGFHFTVNELLDKVEK